MTAGGLPLVTGQAHLGSAQSVHELTANSSRIACLLHSRLCKDILRLVDVCVQGPGQWPDWSPDKASQERAYQYMLARQQEQEAQQAQQQANQLQMPRAAEGSAREQSPPIPVPLVKKKRT